MGLLYCFDAFISGLPECSLPCFFDIKGECMDTLIMDMPKIPGECQVPGFQGKIELLAFTHGVAMQMSGDVGHPERISGRPTHQDFAVTKHLDAASTLLNLACCAGTDQGSVKITLVRREKDSVTALMVYELSHVIISSISISGASGAEMPMEVVTLNYTHIKWTFIPSGAGTPAGNMSGGWDVGANQPL
jgi:type VI secretion system secreted protein Hcp